MGKSSGGFGNDSLVGDNETISVRNTSPKSIPSMNLIFYVINLHISFFIALIILVLGIGLGLFKANTQFQFLWHALLLLFFSYFFRKNNNYKYLLVSNNLFKGLLLGTSFLLNTRVVDEQIK
ncbi:MAG: hypothetical protein F6K63_24390 [Moorea sp. SIO1G6]|uniref:hypothetical protein n=1 Tax=Moorena sp. SIO1G6 TaxID=2607840 RepID=UPI0013C13880|nr:hypothetical protein [Moorena sp. SIO1G6]NET67352.1 hypothetical protein [Moorena sp. SIO1G6]